MKLFSLFPSIISILIIFKTCFTFQSSTVLTLKEITMFYFSNKKKTHERNVTYVRKLSWPLHVSPDTENRKPFDDEKSWELSRVACREIDGEAVFRVGREIKRIRPICSIDKPLQWSSPSSLESLRRTNTKIVYANFRNQEVGAGRFFPERR